MGRKISVVPVGILTTTSLVSLMMLSIASAVPPNTKSVDIQGTASNVTSGLYSAALYVSASSGSVAFTELLATGGNNTTLTSVCGNASGIPIVTQQTLYYSTLGQGGTAITFSLSILGYTF